MAKAAVMGGHIAATEEPATEQPTTGQATTEQATTEQATTEQARRSWAAMRRLVEAYARIGDVRDALGLGAGVGRVRVMWLLEGGPMTLSEIAEAYGVDAPYATLIVDKLASLGYVERHPHPDDRRRKLVHLTAAGGRAAAYAHDVYAEAPPPLSVLEPVDLAELDRLMAKLVRALD